MCRGSCKGLHRRHCSGNWTVCANLALDASISAKAQQHSSGAGTPPLGRDWLQPWLTRRQALSLPVSRSQAGLSDLGIFFIDVALDGGKVLEIATRGQPGDRRYVSLRLVAAFAAYMEHGGHAVTRAQFERNMALKMADGQFTADISPLLSEGFDWNLDAAAEAVSGALIATLPGTPWDGQS